MLQLFSFQVDLHANDGIAFKAGEEVQLRWQPILAQVKKTAEKPPGAHMNIHENILLSAYTMQFLSLFFFFFKIKPWGLGLPWLTNEFDSLCTGSGVKGLNGPQA